ncbi:MAG: hypothetical protein LBH75_04450 [Treponema sp.]|jgi:hypothetical protein|nr:hypothetical protein [Treponema sp.]
MKKIILLTLLAAAAASAQEVGFDDFINQHNIFTTDEESARTEEESVRDEGFGFGFENRGLTTPSLSATISGEASAEALVFIDELESTSKMKEISLGDIFSGALNFSAKSSNAEAVINLKLQPSLNTAVVSFDEAYVRGFLGGLSVEAGLRKLAWGKADSLGPLDVINPLDYTDLIDVTSVQNRKIAVPMIHVSYGLGAYSRLEAVFVPSFTPQKFAESGRWAPSQLTTAPAAIETGARAYFVKEMPPALSFALLADPTLVDLLTTKIGSVAVPHEPPHTEWLKYMQAGLRFTTTVKSADVGVQGYFGRLPRPAFVLTGLKEFWSEFNTAQFETEKSAYLTEYLKDKHISTVFDYNYFAQLGVDYAQTHWGFNTRSELALNLTKDLKGDDGEVYNPFISFSVGFDRDIAVKGVTLFNVNLQINENIRLFSDKINSNRALDIEADSNNTSSRVTLIASRKFFRDELEVNFTGLWGIEDKDFYFVPSLIWTRENLAIGLYSGVFLGNSEGELGQYHKNSFARMTMTYTF